MKSLTSRLAFALLAGQIATAAYLPVRRHYEARQDPAYNPTTSSYQPSVERDNGFNPINGFPVLETSISFESKQETTVAAGVNPINGLPVPDATSSRKLSSSAAKHTSTAEAVNPINGLPVPSAKHSSTKHVSTRTLTKTITTTVKPPQTTAESANPTAVPSAFPTEAGMSIVPITWATLSGGKETWIPIISLSSISPSPTTKKEEPTSSKPSPTSTTISSAELSTSTATPITSSTSRTTSTTETLLRSSTKALALGEETTSGSNKALEDSRTLGPATRTTAFEFPYPDATATAAERAMGTTDMRCIYPTPGC